MSRDQPSAYVCGGCGRSLPSGARWCPDCHSTDAVFVAPESDESAVIPPGPPVHRQEQVASERMPIRDSLREVRASKQRDRDDKMGRVEGRYRCSGCGATKRPGERRCYRCGGAGWVERDGPGGFFACGSCDAPMDEDQQRRWCRHCRAPGSAATYIHPTESETRADETAAAFAAAAAAAPANPYRRFGTGSKIAWTALVLLLGVVVLVFSVGSPDFSGKEAAWGPPGYVVMAGITLWAVWRR